MSLDDFITSCAEDCVNAEWQCRDCGDWQNENGHRCPGSDAQLRDAAEEERWRTEVMELEDRRRK